MKRILDVIVSTSLNEGFWLSYWPHSISIIAQACCAYITLTFPYKSELLHNGVLLVNAIGMAVSLRNLVKCHKWKMAQKARIDKMHADACIVIEAVSPLLDELFERELGRGFDNMDHHALMRAQALAQEIIEKGFADLDKNRSSESTPDKT
jgi:hypothetical protein